LHVFLTVAKEQSFSRAAPHEKLYRTQPAVSIVIRKLEESVGQPLLVRGARQVKLTDAGELLRDYAERLLNLRDEIQKGMEDLKNLGRGELRLGVNESSIHALLPALARYRKLYPGVKLIMHRTLSRDIPQEVLNYRLDLGTVSYVPQDPKLAAVEILRDELTFVVPPKHRLARRRSVDIKELGEETFIAHNVDSPYRSRVIQLFEKHRTRCAATSRCPPSKASSASCKWAWAWPSSRACASAGKSKETAGRSPHPPAEDAALAVSGVAPRRALSHAASRVDKIIARVTVEYM
jgi:DNA-binding transcriptional LysR family regulator